jgi:Calcineurin-like phosphoesterase
MCENVLMDTELVWEGLSPKVLACAGDWHANINYARKALRWCAKQGVDVLIHVGDFGCTFLDGFLDDLNNAAVKTGIVIVFCKGNHDDSDYLAAMMEGRPFGPIPLRSNVIHLPQGFRWEWSGISFLALGGAHSIDRAGRHPGVSWWQGEEITWREAELAVSGGRADVMITHDCPTGVTIPGVTDSEPLRPDWRAEVPACVAHQQLLRSVVDEVHPELLFCGHYHCRHTEDLIGGGHTTTVHILDKDGTPFTKNMCVMTMDELGDMVLRGLWRCLDG